MLKTLWECIIESKLKPVVSEKTGIRNPNLIEEHCIFNDNRWVRLFKILKSDKMVLTIDEPPIKGKEQTLGAFVEIFNEKDFKETSLRNIVTTGERVENSKIFC